MKIDYTNLSFTQLIDKIETNRFFDLPRMVREAFRRLLSRVEAVKEQLDSKLDKNTTAGAERVYTINTDGSQATKPTSEFNNVIEGYLSAGVFYEDALHTITIAPEGGKIYIDLSVTPATQYRWSGSAYVQIGGGANTQIFHWWGGNWTTTTLDLYYYISYNNRAIETLPFSAGTTISASMNGRNQGLFIAPFNCKIKRVIFKEGGSGSYTGAFVLASGLPIHGSTWNIGFTNRVTHLNSAITSAGFNQNKFEYLVTDNITVPKGYAVCPMLIFSAQAQATKNGVEISIEIEEVI